jgi:uncharacterized protein YjbJ (UPF0337 family)
MRTLAIALAVAGFSLSAAPTLVQAQSTTKSDAQTAWDKIHGGWMSAKGAVKEQWGKLTDDDLTAIEGRRDQLVGKIQIRYGVSREEAERQVAGWETKYNK